MLTVKDLINPIKRKQATSENFKRSFAEELDKMGEAVEYQNDMYPSRPPFRIIIMINPNGDVRVNCHELPSNNKETSTVEISKIETNIDGSQAAETVASVQRATDTPQF